MKVVSLTHRVPWPPDRGDRITTSSFLTHLVSRGATVRAACMAEDDRDEAAAAEFGRNVGEVCAPRIHPGMRKALSLRALLTGSSIGTTFCHHRKLAETVRRWLVEDPPDLIYAYSATMGLYALDHPGAVRVMQFAELDSDKWRQFADRGGLVSRQIYAREARKMLEFERRVASAFDVSFVVSEVEKQLFMERIPGVEPTVLPNGVDVTHFSSRGDTERDPNTIVFTGVMNYEPNVDGMTWFISECWPSIRDRHPDARMLIVGSSPTPRVLELGRLPGVEVTGRVEETPPYFDRAAVAVAPLRLARGVQNKVLEAMSMGLPVVSSPQAAQGLGDVPAETMCVADGAAATIEAVCRLIGDPAQARAMGGRAATFVRERFRWQLMFDRFDQVIDAATARHQAARGR